MLPVTGAAPMRPPLRWPAASGNDVVIEREDLRFVAHVPDQLNLKVEFEIEDDGTELEIELTW
jgi:amphi-Trp domain-containing protein